jgi:hypothetical protein
MNVLLQAFFAALIEFFAKWGRKKLEQHERDKNTDQAVTELESAKTKEEVLDAANKLP